MPIIAGSNVALSYVKKWVSSEGTVRRGGVNRSQRMKVCHAMREDVNIGVLCCCGGQQ